MATCRVQDPLHVRLRKSCWIFWAREGGEIVSKVFRLTIVVMHVLLLDSMSWKDAKDERTEWNSMQYS